MLNNIKVRTEYSFRIAYGFIEQVVKTIPGDAIGICDRHGTWGHVQFAKYCKKYGKKPIFGVELATVENAKENQKQETTYISFLARNNAGLKELYELATKSTEQFYYTPRIDYNDVLGVSANIFIILSNFTDYMRENEDFRKLYSRENVFLGLSPNTPMNAHSYAKKMRIKCVAVSDNYMLKPEDYPAYQILASGAAESNINPIHVLDEDEWELLGWGDDEAIANANFIAAECNAELPKAEMVHPPRPDTLYNMCVKGAKERGVDLTNEVYKARLDRELKLIHEKGFDDYFYLIADLCSYSKKHMLVGPARGSSAGSLVCYLLYITDIDPIPYDLIFERFIDINRLDYPDIDIDFQDTKRDMVFEYLKETYGADCVARIGSVSRYKAKSTITDVAKELQIPVWEVEDLKGAIIERSGGDARAAFCIMDTFNELDIGKKTLEKYPQLAIAAKLEAHARHTGQHAAGTLVTAHPLSNYCSGDAHTGATQIDKKDAEVLDLLKIDALGLRTLTIIQEILDNVGWTRDDLLNYPMDDQAAFDILNKRKFTGVFQFEGTALQSLCGQIGVNEFEDIVSITALARPGPLVSGGATKFCARRTGKEPTTYLHPMMEKHTKITYGIVVYQEQVMTIGRDIGKLSWEDVSALRKAMSKSLGKEFFDQYWEKFKIGAIENGLTEQEAQTIWEQINTMGSWAFNRSHAVSYGLVSYWTMVLKAKFPIEFAAATLRNAKDEDQCIRLLREMVKEGFGYCAFDKEKSEKNWSIKDNTIYGGYINVKGIGPKIADDIELRRKEGRPLTPRQEKLLETAVTKYDCLFEGKERFGDIYEHPEKYNIATKISLIEELDGDAEGVVLFLGKISEKNLRDDNELINVEKRGGYRIKGQSLFLNFRAEDDTDKILCRVNRDKYLQYGKPIVEDGRDGDWYIFKGRKIKGLRMVNILRWRKIS